MPGTDTLAMSTSTGRQNSPPTSVRRVILRATSTCPFASRPTRANAHSASPRTLLVSLVATSAHAAVCLDQPDVFADCDEWLLFVSRCGIGLGPDTDALRIRELAVSILPEVHLRQVAPSGRWSLRLAPREIEVARALSIEAGPWVISCGGMSALPIDSFTMQESQHSEIDVRTAISNHWLDDVLCPGRQVVALSVRRTRKANPDPGRTPSSGSDQPRRVRYCSRAASRCPA